jgi:hypothetical protein
MLALKSTRLSQGGVSGIDWLNPITKNLCFAATPGFLFNATLRDLTSAGVDEISCADGVAFRKSGSVSAVAVADLIERPTSRLWTVFSLSEKDPGNSSGFSAIWSLHEADQRRISPHARIFNSGNIGVDIRPYAVDTATSVEFPTGSSAALAVTVRATDTADAGAIVYLNGRQIHERAIEGWSTVAFTPVRVDFFGKETNGDQAPVGSKIQIAMVFTRVLDSAEVLALSQNPWQIFG